MPLTPGTADVLSTMAAPTIVQNATGASAAITYAIVAVNEAGQDGAPSATTSTGANNAATANNTVSWVAIPGASQYRVLKNGALLATVGAGVTSYTDSAGSAGATYSSQTNNPAAPAPVAMYPLDGGKPTYSATIRGLTPAASPTDIFTLTGSASKIGRVTHIEAVITSSAATGADLDLLLIKRSTANSAGTSAAATIVPHDSLNPTASLTPLSYTANPTLGNTVGNIRNQKIMPTLATATATDFPNPDRVVWDFGKGPEQGLVIRGTGEVIALNLNAVSTAAGASMDISITWTEE